MTGPIYEARVAFDHYRACFPENLDGRGPMLMLSGEPLGSAWPVPTLIYDDDLDAAILPSGDVTGWATSVLVASDECVAKLGSLLDGAVELLPVLGLSRQHFILNVTCTYPALIEDQSFVLRFAAGIADVATYALDPDQIGDSPIFKLAEWPTGRILVTDAFRLAVEREGLTGFWFRRIWPA